MSTLKTHNLQSPDSGSANIALTQNSGMVVAGISTLGIGASGGVDLLHQNVSRLSTQSYGIAVNGNILLQEELVHIGDTDTRIKFPSAGDTISAETAGSERLRITSTGNIGINDTDPSYKLNVAGVNTAYNGIGMLKGIIGVQNDTTAYGSSPTAGISFQTKYRTGPDVPLDVAAIWGGKENTTNGDKDGYMGFATREEGGSGSQERMRITSDGKIGIGTNIPNTELEVFDEAFANITIHSARTSGNIGGIDFRKGGTATGIQTAQYFVDTSGSHLFHSQGSQKFKISSNGYVTKPEHPYFNCTTTPTAGSPNIHSFGTVHTNNGNHYNNSNGRFTAPVAGFYHFSFGIWCNASGSNTSKHLQLMKYINSSGNTTAIAGANHITQYNNLNGSGGTHLEVGDYVYLHQTGLSIQASTPRNFFSGHLVG